MDSGFKSKYKNKLKLKLNRVKTLVIYSFKLLLLVLFLAVILFGLEDIALSKNQDETKSDTTTSTSTSTSDIQLPTLKDCVSVFSRDHIKYFDLLYVKGKSKLDSNFYPKFSRIDKEYIARAYDNFTKGLKDLIEEISQVKEANFSNTIQKIEQFIMALRRLVVIMNPVRAYDPEFVEEYGQKFRDIEQELLHSPVIKKLILSLNADSYSSWRRFLILRYQEFMNTSEDSSSNDYLKSQSQMFQNREFRIQELNETKSILEAIPDKFLINIIISNAIYRESDTDVKISRDRKEKRESISYPDMIKVLKGMLSSPSKRYIYEYYTTSLDEYATSAYKQFNEIIQRKKEHQDTSLRYNFLPLEEVEKIIRFQINEVVNKVKEYEDDLYKFIQSTRTIDPKVASFRMHPSDMYTYIDWYRYGKKDYSQIERSLRPYFHYDVVLENILSIFERLYGVKVIKVEDKNKYYTVYDNSDVYEIVSKTGKILTVMQICRNNPSWDLEEDEEGFGDESLLEINHENLNQEEILIQETKKDTQEASELLSSFVNPHSPSTEYVEYPQKSDKSSYPFLIVDFASSKIKRSDSICSIDIIRTMFHELGHVFGNLLLEPEESSWFLGSTEKHDDLAEFSSVFMEFFATDPQIIKMYAKHYKTKEPIDDKGLEKFLEASKPSLITHLADLVVTYAYLMMFKGDFTDIESIYKEFNIPRYVIDFCNMKHHLKWFSFPEYSTNMDTYIIGYYLGLDLYSLMKQHGFFSDYSRKMMKKLLNYDSIKDFEQYKKIRGDVPSLNIDFDLYDFFL